MYMHMYMYIIMYILNLLDVQDCKQTHQQNFTPAQGMIGVKAFAALIFVGEYSNTDNNQQHKDVLLQRVLLLGIQYSHDHDGYRLNGFAKHLQHSSAMQNQRG